MRSLYVKFVVMTIVIMLFSSLLAFLISNSYYQHQLKPYNDEKITNIALNVASFVSEQPDIQLNDYFEHLAEAGYQLFLIDDESQESFFGASFRDPSLSDEIKNQVLNGEVYHGILNFPQETFVTGFFANELANSIGVPFTHDDTRYALFIRPDIKLLFNEMHFLFAWLLVLTIVLSMIMVAFSTKYLVKPISQLTAATKVLADGNFNVQLNTTRHDELGELSKSFMSMANKLEQAEETRKEFIANISHDIQSPLSNIKGYSNLLEENHLDQKEKHRYISILNDEIKRLSTLTDQLLLLASLDRDEDLLKKNAVSVDKQLRELIRNHQWQAREQNIMLSYSLPETKVIGDPALLYAVWDNLLTNAIKYNKLEGTIDISIKHEPDSIFVFFRDSGIGINEKETEKIFDRFYRGDASRSKTIGGTGLGLSIALAIMKLHDGKIHVQSEEYKGTTFIVELPRNS